MRRRIAPALLAATLLLGACKGSKSACLANLDCPSGEICLSGSCKPATALQCGTQRACTRNSDCSGGLCSQGCCSSACTADSDCTGGDVCVSGICQSPQIGCRSDTDCESSPASPYCDVNNGACVVCVLDQQCDAGELCVGNACYTPPGCTQNSDCASAPELPYCLVSTSGGTCVACLTDTNCAQDAGTAICNQYNACQAVRTGCQSDGDCLDAGATPHCCPGCGDAGVCVACTIASECRSDYVCLSDDNCAPPGSCADSTDCESTPRTPFCEYARCVACLTDTDCTGTDICDEGNACIPYACNHTADCKDGRICVAGISPRNTNQFLNWCQLASNPTGSAPGQTCTSNSSCKAGYCIGEWPGTSNAGFCQGGCATDADCAAGPYGIPGACTMVSFNWPPDGGATQVSSCVAQCTNDEQCLEGSCLLQADVDGGSWITFCGGARGIEYGASTCADGSECPTGECLYPQTTSFEGFCVDACTPQTASEVCTQGASCPANGVYVELPNGKKAAAHICWGATCSPSNANPCSDPEETCTAEKDPVTGQTVHYCEP